jgi:hypothetical protein
MAKLVRRSAVDWTLLAAALSLVGVACGNVENPQLANQTGGALATGGSSTVANGGSSTANGGASTTGGTSSSTSNTATSTGGTSSTSSATSSLGGASTAGGASPNGGATPTSGGTNSSGGTKTSAGGTSNVAGAKTSLGGAGVGGGGTKTSVGGASAGGAKTSLGGASSVAGANSSGGASPAGGASPSGGAANPGDVYNPEFKEFYGEDCQVPDPKDVKISGQLPDLFVMADGTTKMSKKSDWRCQRAYLKKVVEKYIHGTKPGKPDKVTGTVSTSSIKVNVEHGGKSISFSVSVSGVKSGSGPVPIIIGMGGSSLDATIVSGEGVATGNYDHQGMASETSGSGLFSNIYGNTGAAAQIGWAWGISRVIDVLVDEKKAGRNDIIDPTGVGVTGCSRNGKAAFTVGAFDERIALGIPQESGTGGVSALRIVNTNPKGPNNMTAQSLDSACSEAKGWFGNVFCSTNKGKVDTIPGDTSSIAAMYAPRGLLVLDNSRIGELCSTCQHAASAAAAKVYGALGIEKNIEYNGGNPDDPHNHCTFYAATQGEPLKRAIRAFLTKKATADGRIAPQPAGTADLTKWVPWTAPTLADDIGWGSPPLTKE